MSNRIDKHRSRIITILALAAITTFMIGSPVSAQDNEKAVRDVLIQSAVGFETGDMAALEKLWANDESCTGTRARHVALLLLLQRQRSLSTVVIGETDFWPLSQLTLMTQEELR